MNIIINYDLLEEIRNAKEHLSPWKLMRCKRKKFCFYYVPAITLLNSFLVDGSVLPSLICSLGLVSIYETLPEMLSKSDAYRERAYRRLPRLARQMNDNNVKTSEELLLRSCLDAKEYHFYWNENKLPAILEQKYILVPTYSDDGEKDMPIVQEHTIGTNRYVLSIGRYNRGKRLSLAHNNG